MLPRMGFLLLLVAIAIVVLPRIRYFRNAIDNVPNTVSELDDPNESKTADKVATDSSKSESVTESKDQTVSSDQDAGRSLPFSDDPVFREQLSIIVDKTLELKPYEMSAYWRLLREATDRSYEELEREAKPANTVADLSNLILHPADHRGELQRFQLMVHEVRRFESGKDKDGNPRTIYEVWGSTEFAKKWLYVMITSELPKNSTPETLAHKRADFAGYFMKLQAYHPASSKPSEKPMVSPMFLGRINAATAIAVPPIVSWERDLLVYGYGLIAILAFGGVYFIFRNWMIKRTNRLIAVRETKALDLDWIRESSDQVNEPTSTYTERV